MFQGEVWMCKKVCEVSLLSSKGQHEEKKAVRAVNTPIPYVCEKWILRSSHKCQSASTSDVTIAVMQWQPQNQFCLHSASIPDG